MELKLYNTLTRSADRFSSSNPAQVGLYTCGPTVYNFAHIGNLRTYIFEDVLKRALLSAGFNVKHVMNVTDVGHLTDDADSGDDKMELGASREGKSVWQIADFYLQAFKRDIAQLNIIPPDVWCKATDHIPDQIEMVKQLEAKGLTYKIADGIYFDTSKLPDYGKLARLDIKGLQAGARVEMTAGKKNPTDFALWKFSPTDKKRLMEWPSPWGVGFPGWHIECSAMSLKYLGQVLDIHCGGIDHIAVHHTNEIAQTEAITGKQWVRWWMHGEFLTMTDGEKMAKSAGGFLTLQKLIDQGYNPLAYRYFCLNAHYRQQLAFTWEGLDAAAKATERLIARVSEIRGEATEIGSYTTVSPSAVRHFASFLSAVSDDLNMPRALAAMWGLIKDNEIYEPEAWSCLQEMDKVLGFGLAKTQVTKKQISGELEAKIESLIGQRVEAKKAKDFTRADAIRQTLLQMGVEIKDTPQGTVWTKK